jgi:hypothetical protein
MRGPDTYNYLRAGHQARKLRANGRIHESMNICRLSRAVFLRDDSGHETPLGEIRCKSPMWWIKKSDLVRLKIERTQWVDGGVLNDRTTMGKCTRLGNGPGALNPGRLVFTNGRASVEL